MINGGEHFSWTAVEHSHVFYVLNVYLILCVHLVCVYRGHGGDYQVSPSAAFHFVIFFEEYFRGLSLDLELCETGITGMHEHIQCFPRC